MSLFSLYQPENDIPEQRHALEVLYNTTAGQNWTAGAYFSTAFLEFVEYFAYEYGSYPGKPALLLSCNISNNIQLMNTQDIPCCLSAGIVPVSFPIFTTFMLLKVPWYTPGFSYCRWWGVECCLTSQQSTLSVCTGGLQSVGTLALTGQHEKMIITAFLLLSRFIGTFSTHHIRSFDTLTSINETACCIHLSLSYTF